jgi:hypothetical protein
MRFVSIAAIAMILASGLSAGEKKLMHCFAFNIKPETTQADLDALYKLTDGLPGKVPGLSKVWRGELINTLAQFQAADADTQKIFGGGQKTGNGNFNRFVRQQAFCMEMKDKETRDSYGKHPAHAEWRTAYDKVIIPGTTTMTFMGK